MGNNSNINIFDVQNNWKIPRFDGIVRNKKSVYYTRVYNCQFSRNVEIK